jgi:hypothetical protein
MNWERSFRLSADDVVDATGAALRVHVELTQSTQS